MAVKESGGFSRNVKVSTNSGACVVGGHRVRLMACLPCSGSRVSATAVRSRQSKGNGSPCRAGLRRRRSDPRRMSETGRPPNGRRVSPERTTPDSLDRCSLQVSCALSGGSRDRAEHLQVFSTQANLYLDHVRRSCARSDMNRTATGESIEPRTDTRRMRSSGARSTPPDLPFEILNVQHARTSSIGCGLRRVRLVLDLVEIPRLFGDPLSSATLAGPNPFVQELLVVGNFRVFR